MSGYWNWHINAYVLFTAANLYNQFQLEHLQIGNVLRQSLYVNQERAPESLDSDAEEEPLLKRGQPILTRDLRALRRLINEKVLASEDRIEIVHTLPFVPFITLGALFDRACCRSYRNAAIPVTWSPGRQEPYRFYSLECDHLIYTRRATLIKGGFAYELR